MTIFNFDNIFDGTMAEFEPSTVQLEAVADRLYSILQTSEFPKNWRDLPEDKMKHHLELVKYLFQDFVRGITNDLPLNNHDQHLITRVINEAIEHDIPESKEAYVALTKAMVVQGINSARTGPLISSQEIKALFEKFKDQEYMEYRRLREKFKDD